MRASVRRHERGVRARQDAPHHGSTGGRLNRFGRPILVPRLDERRLKMIRTTMWQTLLAAAALAVGGAAAGADQAEVRSRLRDVRAVPQVGGVGGRRDQEAHCGPLRDPGLPGLAAGQGDRHQPGPDARHGGHDLHRPGIRRAHATRRWRSAARRSCSATSTTGRSIRRARCCRS